MEMERCFPLLPVKALSLTLYTTTGAGLLLAQGDRDPRAPQALEGAHAQASLRSCYSDHQGCSCTSFPLTPPTQLTLLAQDLVSSVQMYLSSEGMDDHNADTVRNAFRSQVENVKGDMLAMTVEARKACDETFESSITFRLEEGCEAAAKVAVRTITGFDNMHCEFPLPERLSMRAD